MRKAILGAHLRKPAFLVPRPLYLLLCILRPLRALGTLGIHLMAAFFLTVFYPLSLPLLLFFIPMLVQFSVCFLVNTLADGYILKADE